MISTAIQQLVNYGLDTGLILPDDEIYIRNQLLMTMQLDSFTEPESEVCYKDLNAYLCDKPMSQSEKPITEKKQVQSARRMIQPPKKKGLKM